MATEAQRQKRQAQRRRRAERKRQQMNGQTLPPRVPQQGRAYPRSRPQKPETVRVSQVVSKAALSQIRDQAGYGGLANELAMAISLPAEHDPIRLASAGGECTSALTFRNHFKAQTPTNTPYLFKEGDVVVALFGQPGRGMMYYSKTKLDDLSASIYDIYFNMDGEDSRFWAPLPNTNIEYTGPSEINQVDVGLGFPIAGALCAGNGDGPHGPTLAAAAVANSDAHKYFFLADGDKYAVTLTNVSGATGNMKFTVLWWQEDSEDNVNGTFELGLTTGSTGNFTATHAGWFRIVLTSVNVMSGTLQGGWLLNASILTELNGGAGRWNLRPYADFDYFQGGDPVMAEHVRTNAASLLVQNTSNMFKAEGSIIAARVRTEQLTKVSATMLGKVREHYPGKAKDGCYTFMNTTATSEIYRSCRSGTNSKFLTYHLADVEFIHVISISNPAPATTPNDWLLVMDGSFEFITDSARYAKAAAPGTLETTRQIRKMINAKPVWFYENPLHMRDVYEFVKRGLQKVGRGVATIAPYASTVASALDPAGAAGYNALAALLTRLH